jgi:hypothetical protein
MYNCVEEYSILCRNVGSSFHEGDSLRILGLNRLQLSIQTQMYVIKLFLYITAVAHKILCK